MTRAILRQATALAAGIVLIGAAQSGAQGGASHPGSNTFGGSCHLSGRIAFLPPLTSTPQAVTQHVQATGTCTGSFTGRHGRTHQLSNAPVSYRAVEYATNASCEAGTDAGSGKIAFSYGSIKFTISETRIVAAAAVVLQGAKGGSALGQANVSPSLTPQQVAAACAGTGMAQAPFVAQATTTPSISG